jgi:hypothetical protein
MTVKRGFENQLRFVGKDFSKQKKSASIVMSFLQGLNNIGNITVYI